LLCHLSSHQELHVHLFSGLGTIDQLMAEVSSRLSLKPQMFETGNQCCNIEAETEAVSIGLQSRPCALYFQFHVSPQCQSIEHSTVLYSSLFLRLSYSRNNDVASLRSSDAPFWHSGDTRFESRSK
jgi:hypothetical protein